MDKWICKGFITAISGFSVEDWGVRNSSLMLFSAICGRTLGSFKNLKLKVVLKIAI
jgi:hypothetical protein